jgi:hypothetical protein
MALSAINYILPQSSGEQNRKVKIYTIELVN